MFECTAPARAIVYAACALMKPAPATHSWWLAHALHARGASGGDL